MDEREKELLQTYRAEAAALFQANQAGRTTAERVVALLFTVVAVAVAAGVNAGTMDVALPLPALALLLLTYTFHQYTDVTMLGMARAELERRTNRILGTPALVYELAVAPIRKRPPLSVSVRMLQALSGLVVLGLLGTGTVVAFEGQHWYVTVAYCIVTASSALTAAVAFKGMLDAPEIGRASVRDALR